MLQEALLDFIKGPDGAWFLLNCKGYKVKGDPIEIKINVKEPEVLDESAISIKPTGFLCQSVSEESLLSDPSSLSNDEVDRIEKAAKEIKFMANTMQRPDSRMIDSLSKKNYLELKEGDELGRIPHRMIGIMPHKQENPITYFIDKMKDPPIKPTQHKERAKKFH